MYTFYLLIAQFNAWLAEQWMRTVCISDQEKKIKRHTKMTDRNKDTKYIKLRWCKSNNSSSSQRWSLGAMLLLLLLPIVGQRPSRKVFCQQDVQCQRSWYNSGPGVFICSFIFFFSLFFRQRGTPRKSFISVVPVNDYIFSMEKNDFSVKFKWPMQCEWQTDIRIRICVREIGLALNNTVSRRFVYVCFRWKNCIKN